MNVVGPANEDHQRHLDAIKRIATAQGRREYLDGVKRAEGPFFARWLADDFAAWWATQNNTRGTRR